MFLKLPIKYLSHYPYFSTVDTSIYQKKANISKWFPNHEQYFKKEQFVTPSIVNPTVKVPSKNNLDETQDTEFKTAITNVLKVLRESKEGTNKDLNELKEDLNKLVN